MLPRRTMRHLQLGTVAIIASATPALAQQAIVLDPVILESQSAGSGASSSTAHVRRTATGALKSTAPIVSTPQAISVIPEKTMEEQAVSSVAQALTYSVNTNGQRYGNDPRSDYFTVRGFPADLYLDGLRVPQIANQTGGYGGVVVEPYTLDSIEVLRGPASALFGQSNVGGIVNMNSKLPQDTRAGEIYLRAGSYDRKELGFDLTGPVTEGSDWSYRMIGVVRDGDGAIAFSRNDRTAFAPSLTWRPSDATRLTLSASYLRDDIGQPGAIVPRIGSIVPNDKGQLLPVDVSDGDPRQAVYNKKISTLGYDFEHDLTPDLTLSHSTRLTHMDLDYRGLFSGALLEDQRTVERYNYLAQPDLDAIITDLHLRWDVSTGPVSHEVIAGLDYQRQHLDNPTGSTAGPSLDLYDPDYTVPFTPAEATKRLVQTSYQQGAYLQDTVRWRDLTVVGGLRYDRYRISSESSDLGTGISTPYYQEGEEWTGRLGVSWTFANGLAPYALYSTSFLPVLTLSDTPLKPTEGELREIGVKYAPEDRPWLLSFAYFEAVQSNVVKRVSGVYYQTDEVRAKGWELEAKLDLTDRLHINAAYSHQDPEVTESETAAEVGKMPYTVPKKQASIYVSYDVEMPEARGDLTIGLGARYIGETAGDSENSFMVPSYTVADAFVSYDFDRYRFQLNGYNLADKRYVAGCNVSTQCYFGAERTAVATLAIRF